MTVEAVYRLAVVGLLALIAVLLVLGIGRLDTVGRSADAIERRLWDRQFVTIQEPLRTTVEGTVVVRECEPGADFLSGRFCPQR